MASLLVIRRHCEAALAAVAIQALLLTPKTLAVTSFLRKLMPNSE
ncbi:MAG: hypothetical protein WCG04_00685 [Alphaproteobacteria bacterium]